MFFPSGVAATTRAEPLELSANTLNPITSDSGPSLCSPAPLISPTVTVTPTGGRAPYTYSWSRSSVPATGGPFDQNNSTGRSNFWSDTRCDNYATNSEEYRCRVTSSDGQQKDIFVTVTLQWADTSPPPISLSVDNTLPSGTGEGESACSPAPLVTDSVTVTASGGTPPYAFAWTLDSLPADGGPFTADNPTSQTTTFSAIRCDNHIDNSERWICTVTDDNAQQASIAISNFLQWTDTTPPTLEVTVDNSTPAAVDSGASLCSPAPMVSPTVTVTATGGVEPYTYRWTRSSVPATGGPFSQNDATGRSNFWSDTRCDNHSLNAETYTCEVTSADDQTANVEVNVTLQWTDISPPPIQLSVDNNSPFNTGSGNSPCSPLPLVSNSVTVSATGGTPPYSYAWTRDSAPADGNAFAADSPTSQTTTFSATRCDVDVDNSERWLCTVTDDASQQATITVNVLLEWTDTSPSTLDLVVDNANPTTSESGFSLCSITPLVSPTATVTASGGVPPYTYLWTRSSTPSTAGPFAQSNATGTANSWSDIRCDNYAINTEEYRCRVTDQANDTRDIFVTVTLQWTELALSEKTYSVTAEEFLTTGNIGFSRTLLSIGSLTPDEPFNGLTIEGLFITQGGSYYFEIVGVNVPNNNNTFREIVVTTNEGTVTLDRNDASYSGDEAGNTRFAWFPFTDTWTPTSSYNVEIKWE